jgi:hypothetical protein
MVSLCLWLRFHSLSVMLWPVKNCYISEPYVSFGKVFV